jgi:hypothetical protein
MMLTGASAVTKTLPDRPREPCEALPAPGPAASGPSAVSLASSASPIHTCPFS